MAGVRKSRMVRSDSVGYMTIVIISMKWHNLGIMKEWKCSEEDERDVFLGMFIVLDLKNYDRFSRSVRLV